jgi:hypothetical protein
LAQLYVELHITGGRFYIFPGNNKIQANIANDLNRLARYEITTSLTLTDYQAIVDKAINLGGLVYFNLHDIVSPAEDATDITPADFHAIVDYVKTKTDADLIDVVTISEWYNGLSGSLTTPTIGTPTVNSTSSIAWNWTDNSSLEDTYRVDYVNNGGSTANDVDGLAASAQTWTDADLSPNTQYSVHVHAFRAAIGESPASATSAAVYTLANTPNASTVNNIAATTMDVNPVTGGVESAMAIYAETGASCDGAGGLGYVQSDGSISASAVWQTDAAWGTKTVTGLTPHTQYSFCAKARNGDSAETSFGVSTSGTTLFALNYSAGSHGSLIGSTSQSVAPSSSGSAVTAFADINYHFVDWSDASISNPRTDTDVQANVTVTANFSPNGSTKAARSVPVELVPLSIAVHLPATGAKYDQGKVVGIEWSPENGSFLSYKAYYSHDGGLSWSLIGSTSSTSIAWTVPSTSAASGSIKIEGYGADGALLASVLSGSFSVAVPSNAQSSATDTGSSLNGAYTPSAALASVADIDADKGLLQTSPPSALCVDGSLIKGSLSSVYYCGSDGKRYVFPNIGAYSSWYADFSAVETISNSQLALIPLGGNVTYRPGKKMIKIQTDPKVYAVARGGVLRWVSSEVVARTLFGDGWNRMIDDVSDAFFIDYKIGNPI